MAGFNLEGTDQTGSFIGFTFTVALYITMFFYIYNMIFKIRADPEISNIFMEGSRPNDEVLDLNDFDFQIAFAIENLSRPNTSMLNPEYIEWVPMIVEKDPITFEEK